MTKLLRYIIHRLRDDLALDDEDSAEGYIEHNQGPDE